MDTDTCSGKKSSHLQIPHLPFLCFTKPTAGQPGIFHLPRSYPTEGPAFGQILNFQVPTAATADSCVYSEQGEQPAVAATLASHLLCGHPGAHGGA